MRVQGYLKPFATLAKVLPALASKSTNKTNLVVFVTIFRRMKSAIVSERAIVMMIF